MVHNHNFARGDQVRWNPALVKTSYWVDYTQTFGEEPLIIADTKLVDPHCTCGASHQIQQHHEQCGVHLLDHVGHPQFVRLEGHDATFSGAWFLPVDRF